MRRVVMAMAQEVRGRTGIGTPTKLAKAGCARALRRRVMDFDGASRKGKVDAVARARAAREQRERVSANLSDQHKAAVASKLQGGARRFLTVLRSRALLRAEWRCPPSPSNGQQLVICLWLLRFFDPLHDGVALCTLCRAVVAGLRPALGAPPRVPLRAHPCVNQEWSRTSRP